MRAATDGLVIGNLEARGPCRSNSMAGTGELVSSEGVGLAHVDRRVLRPPDSRWGGCRERGAGETRAGVKKKKSGSD